MNFLVASQSDSEFRESLLRSDLCPVDGTPIVWIARLLGIPISKRVSGSDIFEALKVAPQTRCSPRVFLLGGAPGVAKAAAEALKSTPQGIISVGYLNPGYGGIEEMSGSRIIDAVNSSNADLLVVALGAKKGQLWLIKNHCRLKVPVRSHLGATINFQAGIYKRAPLFTRKLGLEWLWRIKEEPHLWRRYWDDGRVLLSLMFKNVLPLAAGAGWRRLKGQNEFAFKISRVSDVTSITLRGALVAVHVERLIDVFRDALGSNRPIIVNLAEVSQIDCRIFGLFLMVRKQALELNLKFQFTGIAPRLERLFRLNRFEYLLDHSMVPLAFHVGREGAPDLSRGPAT